MPKKGWWQAWPASSPAHCYRLNGDKAFAPPQLYNIASATHSQGHSGSIAVLFHLAVSSHMWPNNLN